MKKNWKKTLKKRKKSRKCKKHKKNTKKTPFFDQKHHFLHFCQKHPFLRKKHLNLLLTPYLL